MAGTTSQRQSFSLRVSRNRSTIASFETSAYLGCADGGPDFSFFSLGGVPIGGGRFRARERSHGPPEAMRIARLVRALRATRSNCRRAPADRLLCGGPRPKERPSTTCRTRVTFRGEVPRPARTRFGALRQLSGGAGCITPGGGHGCRRLGLLNDTTAVALSPDGRNVYVAVVGRDVYQGQEIAYQRGAVLAFRRDRLTGVLRRLPRDTGCLREDGGPGCTVARGFRSVRRRRCGATDGRHVYVTSGPSVLVYVRDRQSGALTSRPQCRGLCRPQRAGPMHAGARSSVQRAERPSSLVPTGATAMSSPTPRSGIRGESRARGSIAARLRAKPCDRSPPPVGRPAWLHDAARQRRLPARRQDRRPPSP